MKKLLFSLMLLVALFTAQVINAQAPQATPTEAITALLNRIGGDGAADKFTILIDANLAEDGKDVFIITKDGTKPYIKGNNQLSVATGINWYLNHHAHINLTWNNLTTDFSKVTLPTPDDDEKHVCNTTYRYNFNTCTFSYSMAFWTWDRWQKEIDWMALHGINAPLNLVGLDVVTRNFLKELKISDSDINAYIAGPGFIAWFAMNNLEGWGGTVNATDVTMNGNPDWWYARQEQLCKNMLQRMRELGMQPVIPGFSGQVPNCIVNYSITGFSSADVLDNGYWAGGYTRPDILHPNSSSYATLAPIYYKHLEAIMGVSEFYSMDPFHEGGLLGGVTNATCYPPIMAALDTYHNAVEDATKTSYNVGTDDNQAKWIIQYWQNIPQSGAFSSMSNYGDRFIGLDLFSDNIYADNAAKWRDTGTDDKGNYKCYFQGRPYIYCMLHNFGGRSGLHGRLETTMDGYFEALNKGNNCQGIGATPEGTETNPILYDMLFELPWMDPESRPTADEWLAQYAHSRYGVDAATAPNALKALQNLKNSVWNCERNQQGTSEAIILGRPRWTFGDGQRSDGTSLEGTSVSSWSVSSIYWDTQDVRLAADQLISINDLVTTEDGIANYDYDVIDVIRQAMVDYASELLPLIKAARNSGDNDEYTRLYKLFLQLMIDLDTMLSYDENFKLERWTSLARNIADEGDKLGYTTTTNDRNWLEWNARTQVSVWSKGNNGLNDYSNRCWAGLIKDFHYPRWEYFFENNGATKDGNWFTSEYAWTVDYTNYDYSKIEIPEDMTATQKAVETFGKYFGRVKSASKNYLFPMGVTTNGTKSDVVPTIYRDKTVTLPLEIGKTTLTDGTTPLAITTLQIDLNGDGAMGDGETLTTGGTPADGITVAIPATAAIGKTKATATFNDGTSISFNLAIIEDITEDRTVTAATADAVMGSVAIEGTNELYITNKEAVTITATANTGYNFKDWTDEGGNIVSNDNPFIYYGKEAATFTANFIQDKWGVVECNGTLSGDIAGYLSFIHELTFAYYNREPETILETTTAPTQIFNTIPQIINVPRGASFDVEYVDDGTTNDNYGLQYCYFRAYIDLNADGDFDDEGELLKEVGTSGAQNAAVCSNKMNVLLPYDAPLGITHMRLRFDGAWDNSNNPAGNGAKDPSIRPVYEIVLNITEGSDKAAHITVESNNNEWGTAEVWTSETPNYVPGSEWDVSAGIYANIKATPASSDAEFLGWYDHYGRLLTKELQYSMLAKEDATYTARFRKFLEIDGWQVEYRTEPNTTKLVTTELGSTKPEAGKKYYIYAKALQSDNSFATHYLYNNGDSLATATTPSGDAFIWIATADGDYLTFENAGTAGQYIGYGNSGSGLTVNTTPVQLDINSTYAKQSECVGIQRVGSDNNGKYMVTAADGSSFNRYAGSVNNGSWCSDYVFTEVTYPDNIILTKVRQSGNNDLTIPETVEVLGQQCTIIGFDNGLFNNNKELWSINLPASMEFLSDNTLYSTSFNGTITPEPTNTTKMNQSDSQIIDLGGYALTNDKAWTLDIAFESDGSLYNKWGNVLLAGGENATTNQWLYLTSVDNGGVHLRVLFGSLYVDNGTNYFKELTLDKTSTFKVSIANQGDGTAIVTVTNSEGTSLASSAVSFSPNGVTKLSTLIPTGVNITELKITEGAKPCAFSGCSNLDAINVASGGATYSSIDGCLYNADGSVLLCTPEGKAKGEKFRALAALIEDMKELTAQVGTFDPEGTDTELALQATSAGSDFYIRTNATNTGDSNEGPIADLVDDNTTNYFHTQWESSGASSDNLAHYIEIFMNDKGCNRFKFKYTTRNSVADDFPQDMYIYGSNKENTQGDESGYTLIHSITSGMPNDAGKEYTSAIIEAEEAYKYLRFMVKTTNTNRKGSGAKHNYWHMAEFDLYKVSASATVFKIFEGTELTNEFAAARYDVLLSAIDVYENGTTAGEMETAITALQTAYNELEDKMNTVLPFKLTIDEENPVLYNINFKRGDTAYLKYLESNKMVSLQRESITKASYYTFYFMNSAGGVLIKPFNADGKVLGANDISNGHSKISAIEEGADGYAYEWEFVAQSDGYYNIKITKDGSSNYMSDFGNYGEETGFYYSDNTTDAGSLFKFTEATFTDENARFYQLSDVKPTMLDAANVFEGTTVGLYAGGSEYRTAYNNATTLITAGSATSTSDDCHTAYKALRAARENLSYNEPDPEKVYYIISASTNAYCADHYMHTNQDKITHWGNGWSGTYSHKHLVHDAYIDIANKSLAAFQFEETGTEGKYKIKNVHTGLYIKAFGSGAEHMGAEGQNIVIAGVADGQVTLNIEGATDANNRIYAHARNEYGDIVTWSAEANNASVWRIEEAVEDEVEDIEIEVELAANESGNDNNTYATFYSGYTTEVPAGVNAYIVTDEPAANVITLTQLAGNIIPAGTPVILTGSSEDSKAFKFSKEVAETPEGNILDGTSYVDYVQCGSDYELYLLTRVNGVVAMRRAYENYDSNGTKVDNANSDDGGYVKCPANKAYLKLSTLQAANSTAYYFSFSGLTGIDEIENENNPLAGTIYDLHGRKISEVTVPGLYIIDGKLTNVTPELLK